jgi:putative acetyltransferase
VGPISGKNIQPPSFISKKGKWAGSDVLEITVYFGLLNNVWMITTRRTTSDDPAFLHLVADLDKDLRSRYDELQKTYDQYNKVPGLATVVVGYDGDVPAGCGCFKPFDEHSVEIKRMFVSPGNRGTGIASVILRELEQWAKELGYDHAVLETGTRQHEAIRFYQREGYTIIENYGQYLGMETSMCMKKKIS